jgi:hypothetical protein
MRKPHEITIDRALLVYLLQLCEPFGLMSDVKLQQLAFLCELQMLDKRLRGLHFEFFRYAYGAFSKDLDNDLLSLRRKGRLENFDLTEEASEAVKILLDGVMDVETNAKAVEIFQAVIGTYGPQDSGAITKSVEAVEVSSPVQPELKLSIKEVSFHTILLVPARIEVESEFTLTPAVLAKLSTALGY